MIRNSIIYRRIWYIKRRNSKRLYIYFRLLSIIIILAAMAFYAENYSIPYIAAQVECQMNEMVQREAENLASEIYGKEAAAEAADMVQAHEFSNYISAKLEERLQALKSEDIYVPMGALLGDSIFAKAGPGIRLQPRLMGEVDSSVDGDGSGDSAYVHVQARVRIAILFDERIFFVKATLPIGESYGQ